MSDIYNQTVAYEPNYDDYPSEVIAISKFNMLFAQHEWFFDVSSKKKANMVCKALNENAQLQATIAEQGAEIAGLRDALGQVYNEAEDRAVVYEAKITRLKVWVEGRDKIMADQAKKIARLLAVEVAAKEISDDLIRPHHRDIESDEMLYSCERCSVLHNSSVDFPHGPDCEVLVINPIGDNK